MKMFALVCTASEGFHPCAVFLTKKECREYDYHYELCYCPAKHKIIEVEVKPCQKKKKKGR